MNLSHDSIAFLKGVGPQRAELLNKELNIFTLNDLLNYFPFRYIDRSKFYKIEELNGDMPTVQVIGRFASVSEVGQPRRKRLVAQFQDETGSIELVWFKGVKWIKPQIKPNVEYVIFGKPSLFNGRLNIAHPDIELLSKARQKTGAFLQPVYSTTEKLSARGLHSKGIEKLTRELVTQVVKQVPEVLSDDLRDTYKLIDRSTAYEQIHFPSSSEMLQQALYRLKFEELFFIQMQILRAKGVRKANVKGYVFDQVGDVFTDFYNNHLPFELTGAQKRVVKEIRLDMKSGKQMNRLLQGDVGSGKTIVSLLCMMIAKGNGFQSAMMAPTEILANQHFEGVSELAEKVGLRVELLTGSTKQKQRTILLADLLAGEIDILIGTHALLEDKVKFNNLGLVVIDEQHRFGVGQRAKMWKKNDRAPHMLVMSATPIHRTLAMTLYGDLDVSVIDELPPGRKEIRTVHRYDSQRLRVFEFMREEIKKGRQVYVVYPLIEESEKLDYKDLTDGFESICRAFPMPNYQVSIVHGRLKGEDKEYEMQRFVKGETNIMVATTVIEVGVNVPNASVMVIESAERFGLSQLHQLRGRVGRGAEQSFCILMTDVKLSSDARTRMETMVRTTDGFEVAEVDLNLRGPGDLMGTQQSGMLNLQIADLTKDGKILQVAREAAMNLMKTDPNMESPHRQRMKSYYIKFSKERPNWSLIS